LEEVEELLVVDLEEGTVDHEWRLVVHGLKLASVCSICHKLKLLEKLLNRSGDYSELGLVLE
jgi:hypothetical protein